MVPWWWSRGMVPWWRHGTLMLISCIGGLDRFRVTPLVGGGVFQMHHGNRPICSMVASLLVFLSSRLLSRV